MTTFLRRGHWRAGTWVDEHYVTRDDWDKASYNTVDSAPKLQDAATKTYNIQESCFSSFVNPNANCPVCGEKVFYFQNEAGSKVYFDELGPPWPKHACLDNYESQKTALFNKISVQKNQNFSASLSLSTLQTPAFLLSQLKRNQTFYYKLRVFLKSKGEVNCYVLANNALPLRDSIIWIKYRNLREGVLEFFDLQLIEQGSCNVLSTYNRLHYIIALKLALTSFSSLAKLRGFPDTIGQRSQTDRIRVCNWFYDNTSLNFQQLALLCVLDEYEVEELANNTSPSHTPMSPLQLELLDSNDIELLKILADCSLLKEEFFQLISE